MRRGFTRYSCISTFLFLAVALAAAADDGVANGKFTLGGKTVALTHAYAVAQPDTFDASRENVLVILSDTAIPGDSLWEDFPGLKLAAAGQLHAIQVILNADRSVKMASILDNAFER